jgi:kinesin family member C2/C3
LLSDNVGADKLEIRQGDHGNYVPNLTIVPVTKMDQVVELLTFADRNRSKASTNMNEHSSRSHLMLSVNVESTNKVCCC